MSQFAPALRFCFLIKVAECHSPSSSLMGKGRLWIIIPDIQFLSTLLGTPWLEPIGWAKTAGLPLRVLSSPIAGNHVLYKDESDAHILPTLRSMRMLRGKHVRVPTSGTNQKKSVFGAMDIRTGAFMHVIFDRKQAVEFIEFLEHIVSRYPAGKIHISLDNFGVHKARSVQG